MTKRISIKDLPVELILRILHSCSNSSQANIGQTSRFFHEVGNPVLYRHVMIKSKSRLPKICQTLQNDSIGEERCRWIRSFRVIVVDGQDNYHARHTFITFPSTWRPVQLVNALVFQYYDFGHDWSLNLKNLTSFIRFPNLQSLNLRSVVYEDALGIVLHCNATLKSLTIHSLAGAQSHTLGFTSPAFRLSGLQSLSVPSAILTAIIPQTPHIQELCVDWSPELSSAENYSEVLRVFPKRKVIDMLFKLRSQEKLVPFLRALSTSYPGIETLRVQCYTHLAPFTNDMASLFSALPFLKRLSLFCTEIRSENITIEENLKILSGGCPTLRDVSCSSKFTTFRWIKKDKEGWTPVQVVV